MIEKKQINHIRSELIAQIRHAVENQNGCIGTYFKNRGMRLTDTDFDGAEEYDNSLSVGIYDADSLSLSPHETMIVLELFICTDDGTLCCTFKPEGQTRFDGKIESVITDSLLTIVEWLVEHGFDSDSEEETLYCAECGSVDVEVMAWVKGNEGKMFSTDIGGNNDEESNYCQSCGGYSRLLTHTELMEHIQSWWEGTDSDTREKITGISISRFDGGEIPAYESACQASWDALTDDEKIATWQKCNYQ